MLPFFVFSSIALVSNVMVIRAKNPVHSILFFINTSSLLVLLGLNFFASGLCRNNFRFIFICSYDVKYQNNKNSPKCIALFTRGCYDWTFFFVGNIFHYR